MKKSVGFLLVFLIVIIIISLAFGSSIRKYEGFDTDADNSKKYRTDNTLTNRPAQQDELNSIPQNIQNDLQKLQTDIANALNSNNYKTKYSPTTYSQQTASLSPVFPATASLSPVFRATAPLLSSIINNESSLSGASIVRSRLGNN